MCSFHKLYNMEDWSRSAPSGREAALLVGGTWNITERSQSLSVSDSSWFLHSYSRCTRGDMSGRVGDLSVKQAEALSQVNYYSFIHVKSMSWIYLLRVLEWNILPIREATDENSRITLVLNAESIDFYKSTKVLVNRSFSELCKLRNRWSLQCCQHVNRCW